MFRRVRVDTWNECNQCSKQDNDWRKHTLAWVAEDGKVRLDYRAVVTEPLTTLAEGGIDPKKIAPKARVY